MNIDSETLDAFKQIEADIHERMEIAMLMIRNNAEEFSHEDRKMMVELISNILASYKNLEKLKSHLDQIKDYLAQSSVELNLSYSEGASTFSDILNSSKDNTRRIEVKLTNGMINQNLLTLTQACKKGIVRLNEKFKLTMPDGESIATELVSPGNRLKERGAFGRLYRQEEAKHGDKVILKEESKGHWQVQFEATQTTTKLRLI